MSLKEGEISGVVESDFGFHIIKLTGIHAAKEKPLADVRGEIEAELKKAAGSRKFAEAAEAFSNMVYEQSDSLKPVAEKFKLTIKTSDWLARQANPANGVLGNEKLMAALFSEDSVKNRRNTEAVEIAANTLVAARLADYKPKALQPFEGVKANIETLLKNKEAQVLASKDGEARLEALKKGDDKIVWGPAKSVSRMDTRQLPPPAAQSIFRMETGKLPSYAGVELPGAGYALFKLSKVQAGEKLDAASAQGMLKQLDNFVAKEDVQIYLAALRSRYKVEVNQAALESKDK
jgi:peptidyl-prolyl cis-trans isomerase D